MTYGGQIGSLWGTNILLKSPPIWTRFFETIEKGVSKMPAQPLKNRTLPLDLPKPSAAPSGSLMDTRKPYSLPLSNEITLTRCLGPYTEIDRKLWATLIAMAWNDLSTKSIHEADIRAISKLFRELKGARNGSSWVMASAKRLMRSTLDWEDEEEIGATTLLSGLKITKASGKIYYQFSDFMLDKILDNKRFCRLRLHFMIGLSGKYSVSMYMLLETAVNMRQPVIEMSIEELRSALSVPKGKLANWKDFNKYAIQPALKQINENTAGSGFSVKMETEANGRKYERVRFIMEKSEDRIKQERQLKQPPLPINNNTAAPSPASPPAQGEIVLKTFAYENAKKAAPGYDIYALEADWREWVAKSGKGFPENPEAAFIGFCRRKAKERPLD